MIRRLLRVLAGRGEMPDPVDTHWRSVIADLWANGPQDMAEQFADDVEHWLCSQTCFPPTTEES